MGVDFPRVLPLPRCFEAFGSDLGFTGSSGARAQLGRSAECEGTILTGAVAIAGGDGGPSLTPAAVSDVGGTGLAVNEAEGVGQLDGHAEVCGEVLADAKGCWRICADSSGCCNAN